MKKLVNNKREKVFSINYKLFLFVLLTTPLYLFKNRYIKLLGSISIATIFLLTIFDVVWRMAKIKVNKTWFWFAIFCSYNVVLLLRTPTKNALYSFLLQTLLLFFISLLTSITLDERAIENIFKWGRFLCSILLIPASIIALEGGRIAFVKFNDYFSPVIYKIMLPCTFFFIPNTKHKFPKILFFSFIYFRVVERTSSFVLIIVYIIYLVLEKAKKHKGLYKLIFAGTLILIIGFTYGYVQLQYTETGQAINIIIREYTGGNFFSGRNVIWHVAFNYIKESPIWGYGLDNRLLRFAGIDLSTHNTYIHILLQGGMVGLFIFIMFMYTIWEEYFNNLDNDIVRTAASYLIGTLIFINFELTLIQNSVVVALFLWFILGIGLIECNNSKRTELTVLCVRDI